MKNRIKLYGKYLIVSMFLCLSTLAMAMEQQPKLILEHKQGQAGSEPKYNFNIGQELRRLSLQIMGFYKQMIQPQTEAFWKSIKNEYQRIEPKVVSGVQQAGKKTEDFILNIIDWIYKIRWNDIYKNVTHLFKPEQIYPSE